MNPQRYHLHSAFAFILPLAAAATGLCDSKPQLPNIVFILADDIGYGDFSCYGAKLIHSPHVDKLAAEGVRFTDAHASGAVCTPTRYAFMTGQYAFRNPAGSHILSGEALLAIDTASTTVASVLKKTGYATGIVGKWHIGLGKGDLDFNRDIKPGPLELGFDYAFYYPATGDRVPCVFIENHRVVGLDPHDPIAISYGKKVGDEPTGREHPELLTMHPSAGHADTIINGISRIGFMSGGKAARWKDDEMADTLTHQAVKFIDDHHDKPFFLYLATHDIHVPRVPNSRFKGQSRCGTRGDAVQEFDDAVGTVMARLDQLHLADNTLVIVTSDNGGVIDDGYLDGSVKNLNGHRCNGELHGFKGSVFEGGHREPFIARWPGKIAAGGTSDQLICIIDMLATFATIAGQPLGPHDGPDSFNVLPALLSTAGKRPVREHLVVQGGNPKSLAIRKGTWKLIPAGTDDDGPRRKAKDQLFDLATDLGEKTNVAEQHADIVADMRALLKSVKTNERSRP